MFTRSQAKNRRTEHDFLLGRSWRCGGFFCFMGCCVIVAPGTRRTVSCPGCWWIPGAVPLSSRKNAKGGEQGRHNSPAAQTSVPCPPTHSPGSQEEAMPLKSGTRGRRWSCAGGWRERGGREEILRWEVRKMVNCVESVAKFVELGVLWGSWVVY